MLAPNRILSDSSEKRWLKEDQTKETIKNYQKQFFRIAPKFPIAGGSKASHPSPA